MEPPVKPDESDCCNSGCNPCILDVYEEQLKKYNQRNTQDILLKSFKNCLIPTCYSIFKVTLIEKPFIDALLITFEFENFCKNTQDDRNNLKVVYNPGQHVMLKAGPKNEEYQRPYTPIPINVSNKLQFTVLIKIYEIGQMSRYIEKLKIGAQSIWRGPYGHFTINYTYKHILLIAQGVGIAPLYTIIRKILDNENCYTFLRLYFCCRSCDNIYLRDQLYNLLAHWNFSYVIFLSNAENSINKYNETIYKHKLNENVLKEYLTDKFECTQVLICGSETFMSNIKEIVIGCGIEEQNTILF